MSRLVVLLLAVGALLLALPASGNAAKRCGDISSFTGNIRAKNAGCRTARTVARRWERASGSCGARCTCGARCSIRGWRYRFRECGHECGKIVARRGPQLVVFYTGA
jgi:hypothetical protein